MWTRLLMLWTAGSSPGFWGMVRGETSSRAPRDAMSVPGRYCCKSILWASARNIESFQSAEVQLRFVAPAILILSLRQS
jgi:hypothetical protein